MIMFFVLTPIAIWARTYQLANLIDPITGFTIPAKGVLVLNEKFIIGIIAFIFILLMAAGRFIRRLPSEVPSKSPFLAATTAIMTAAFTYGAMNFYSENITKKLTVTTVIFIVAAAAAILSLLYHTACYALGLVINEISTIFPTIFWGVMLGFSFIEKTGITRTVESVFEVTMLCSVLLFLHSQGRMQADISFHKAVKWIYGIGCTAAALCLTVAVPRIYLEVFTETKIHSYTTDNILSIALALHIIVFLIIIAPKKTSNIKIPTIVPDTGLPTPNEKGEIRF